MTHAPDTLLELILVGAGGAAFIVFAVALQNFFVQPPTLTRMQRLFQDLSVLLGLTHGLALLVLEFGGSGLGRDRHRDVHAWPSRCFSPRSKRRAACR